MHAVPYNAGELALLFGLFPALLLLGWLVDRRPARRRSPRSTTCERKNHAPQR